MTGQVLLPGPNRPEPNIRGSVLPSESPMPDPGHELNDLPMEPIFDVDQMGADGVFQGDKDSLDKASRMQLQWNEGICKNTNLPEGYQKIAVLIIKWVKELDELNCAAEVEELNDLFVNGFNYETQIVELSLKQKPQLQLIHAISAFSMKYNSRNNLMIVYYTGHSKFHEENKVLEFYASNEMRFHNARACWNTAETCLINDVESDVLAILDTCFASNLQKNVAPPDRCYELLAASHADKTTSGPGPRSFTRALIKSLKLLLEKRKERGFTTWNLAALITEQPERKRNPPYLNDRLKYYNRRIRLAPLETNPVKRRRSSAAVQPNCYLTLGFSLDLPEEQLSSQQIESLTVDLPKAFKKAGIALGDINWLGLRTTKPYTDLTKVVLLYSNVSNYVNKWRRKVEKVDTTRPIKRRRSESTLMSPDMSRKRVMSQDTRNGEVKPPSPVSDAGSQSLPRMENCSSSNHSDMGVE